MSKAWSLDPIHTTRESTPCFEQHAVWSLTHDPTHRTTVYHAGHDYAISMQPLHADFDEGGFPMHIPAPKLPYNCFTAPSYVNYLASS